MEEQSDTPRTEMAEGQGLNPYFEGRFDGESDELCALRLTLARERDEARALNVEWAKKAETWLATPEAAQRLQSYRDLGQQVAEAQNERDEARAIANDRDAMVDHRDRALTAMYQRVDVITQERDEAIAEVERLRSALRGLHDDIVEYQRINHLGGYDNHWMLAARAALAATESKP